MNDSLAPLEQSVRFYEEQLKMAQEVFDRAQANLHLAQRNLALARSFFDMEKRRLQPDAAPDSRLAGMSLREACITIVMEKGRATSDDIARELAAANYGLRTRFPRRAIHAALMHARGVRKVGSGIYEASGYVPS
jgi:hypothetical protein